MIIFILNMVAVSMVVLLAVFLIILRKRVDTQLLMAGVCLEALVALSSLMWIEPDQLNSRFLAIRMLGRTLEGLIMVVVIINQLHGMQRAALNPTMTEVITKEIEDLRQQIAELKGKLIEEESANAATH